MCRALIVHDDPAASRSEPTPHAPIAPAPHASWASLACAWPVQHRPLKTQMVVSTALLCRCALQLLKDDAGELLRRLSIICLEDAILHPELPLIVWLMMAHAKVPARARFDSLRQALAALALQGNHSWQCDASAVLKTSASIPESLLLVSWYL